MSFVSIVARKNFITVMSDGQVTDHNSGNIIANNYKKFRKISPKQFIAYTGIKEFCEGIIEQIPFIQEKYDLENLAQQIEQLTTTDIFKNYRMHFGIGGIDSEDSIVFYTIVNHGEINVKFFKPTGDDNISYAFFESGHFNGEINITEKLVGFLRNTGYNTPNKCLKAQKMLNDLISDNDPTVNKRTFELIIRK